MPKAAYVIITADHGNADMVFDENGRPFTAHTTNPVPFIVTEQSVALREGGILADIAPTILLWTASHEMTGQTLMRNNM